MNIATIYRAAALCVIAVASAGIVLSSMSSAPAISNDYLIQSEAVADQLADPANEMAEVTVLSDWEYTLRTRPAKCRFIF